MYLFIILHCITDMIFVIFSFNEVSNMIYGDGFIEIMFENNGLFIFSHYVLFILLLLLFIMYIISNMVNIIVYWFIIKPIFIQNAFWYLMIIKILILKSININPFNIGLNNGKNCWFIIDCLIENILIASIYIIYLLIRFICKANKFDGIFVEIYLFHNYLNIIFGFVLMIIYSLNNVNICGMDIVNNVYKNIVIGLMIFYYAGLLNFVFVYKFVIYKPKIKDDFMKYQYG